jgi:hypothetical protein
VVEAAAGVVFKVLDVFLAGGSSIGESIDHTGTVDGILLEAVHDAPRLYAQDLVDGRCDVVDVMDLRPGALVRA